MALEQTIADLVSAANNLTGAVNGKMNEIDQKVDEATASVPNEIQRMSDQLFYVDALDGDDNNDGTSTSSPLKSISALNSRAVNGGRVRILLRENQNHIVSGEGFAAVKSGVISVAKWGSWSDSSTNPVIRVETETKADGLFYGFFCSILSGSVLIANCTIQTAHDIAKGELDPSASFIEYTNSNVYVILYRCKLEMENMAFITAYSGWSRRGISMAACSIEVLANETGVAKLVNKKTNSVPVLEVEASDVTLLGGLTWADLIPYTTDKSSIQTNLTLT